ncbi:hypothetical protein JNB88_14030 [Rhizobium cauense]|uniref:hypothetical protein n=1 Tax=Rhizobium cauense TaxID=1166683 RepID=UPI001C6F5912|nr:hypothetical protein [Rhizobium cauense]MBW9114760.1 hypothetical protein [Rhizobium cauense]
MLELHQIACCGNMTVWADPWYLDPTVATNPECAATERNTNKGLVFGSSCRYPSNLRNLGILMQKLKLLRDQRRLAQQKLAALESDDPLRERYISWIKELDQKIAEMG